MSSKYSCVGQNPGRPVDPQRVAPAGNQKQGADLRALQHVEVAVDAFVSRPFRNRDGGVVDDADEARRIALRRHVDTALRVGGRDEAEWRVGQPVPLDRGQPVLHLLGDGLLGLADDRAELVDGGDFLVHGYIMLA